MTWHEWNGHVFPEHISSFVVPVWVQCWYKGHFNSICKTGSRCCCKNTLIHLTCCLSFSCSGTFFEVHLPSALAAGAKLRVKVETVFSHVLTPFPTHITQAERQLVVFQGNHYLYSPYLTRSQTTRVRLASKTVESYTKLGNPSKNDEVIEYGPFKDIPAFSQVNRMWWWSQKKNPLV